MLGGLALVCLQYHFSHFRCLSLQLQMAKIGRPHSAAVSLEDLVRQKQIITNFFNFFPVLWFTFTSIFSLTYIVYLAVYSESEFTDFSVPLPLNINTGFDSFNLKRKVENEREKKISLSHPSCHLKLWLRSQIIVRNLRKDCQVILCYVDQASSPLHFLTLALQVSLPSPSQLLLFNHLSTKAEGGGLW